MMRTSSRGFNGNAEALKARITASCVDSRRSPGQTCCRGSGTALPELGNLRQLKTDRHDERSKRQQRP